MGEGGKSQSDKGNGGKKKVLLGGAAREKTRGVNARDNRGEETGRKRLLQGSQNTPTETKPLPNVAANRQIDVGPNRKQIKEKKNPKKSREKTENGMGQPRGGGTSETRAGTINGKRVGKKNQVRITAPTEGRGELGKSSNAAGERAGEGRERKREKESFYEIVSRRPHKDAKKKKKKRTKRPAQERKKKRGKVGFQRTTKKEKISLKTNHWERKEGLNLGGQIWKW